MPLSAGGSCASRRRGGSVARRILPPAAQSNCRQTSGYISFFCGDLSTKSREPIVGSPLSWATPQAAPTLIVHGIKDDHVAYEQATWMADRLKSCMVEVELLTREGADAEQAEAALLAFFHQHLK